MFARHLLGGDGVIAVESRSATDVFGIAGAGVGFVIDDRVTIRPGVTLPIGFASPTSEAWFAVPFGRETGEVSLDIAVSFNFMRRK